MRVYHGTSADFPAAELRGGPDTAALSGRAIPGLWLTTKPGMAAAYASWSADCVGGSRLRVIELEMRQRCSRRRSKVHPEDFVVKNPGWQYRSGNLRVTGTEYPVRRTRPEELLEAWLLEIEWDIGDRRILVPSAKMMALMARTEGLGPGNRPGLLR